MSTEKPISDQNNNLNLLLKQQIMNQLKSANDEAAANILETYEEYVTIDKKTSRSVTTKVSKKILAEEASKTLLDWHDMKMTLVNTQMDESAAIENHKILCDHYDLLELVLEHVLQYIECMVLETRSLNRLCEVMNQFGVSDNLITEDTNEQLLMLNEPPDFSLLEQIKIKLIVALNSNDNVKMLRYKCEQRKRDYKLALKNFKIILEVMDMNDASLKKLQLQFEEVLIHYQHARAMLAKEMPYVIIKQGKILAECFQLLGKDLETRLDGRMHFSKLIKGYEKEMAAKAYMGADKALEQA